MMLFMTTPWHLRVHLLKVAIASLLDGNGKKMGYVLETGIKMINEYSDVQVVIDSGVDRIY